MKWPRTRAACPHSEKLFGGTSVQGTVGDLCLLGQVLRALYGGDHPLHSEEGCQVGCVWGDDDEGEKPPNPTDNPPWQRPAGEERDSRIGNYPAHHSGLRSH